ncbi:MAG: glucuronate isomerase [Oscillospiraceae bacterium]|nr:glucuronate isomerase [Oscillospiraceae bacterium]
MKHFLCDNFLLSNKTAETLYHDYAVKMPIFDYHCHVDPQEIAEDRAYDNIAQLWLGGDHYKWRIMRANGVSEEYVTGNADDYDRFMKFAEVLPRSIGNPIYHWTHLELKRYFDCDLILNPENAHKIWEICNEKLRKGLTVRKIIKASNVTAIGTTDDPDDSLEWHIKMKNDSSWDVNVIPTFRPDRLLNSDRPIDEIKAHLIERMDYFNEHGCCIADHGLSHISTPDNELLLFCANEYAKRSWVMQLHFNVHRDVNSRMFNKIGANTGFDCISTQDNNALAGLLNNIENLPKTILYSLNPADNMFLATLAGCFPNMQFGAAWWFNDTKAGMIEQLTAYANAGVLGNFIGMLTDSRSFLSYTRHEYFRRILCNLLGTWVENGEYPADTETLGEVVRDICYNNAFKYFQSP